MFYTAKWKAEETGKETSKTDSLKGILLRYYASKYEAGIKNSFCHAYYLPRFFYFLKKEIAFYFTFYKYTDTDTHTILNSSVKTPLTCNSFFALCVASFLISCFWTEDGRAGSFSCCLTHKGVIRYILKITWGRLHG